LIQLKIKPSLSESCQCCKYDS